jgi:hypothetical protein
LYMLQHGSPCQDMPDLFAEFATLAFQFGSFRASLSASICFSFISFESARSSCRALTIPAGKRFSLRIRIQAAATQGSRGQDVRCFNSCTALQRGPLCRNYILQQPKRRLQPVRRAARFPAEPCDTHVRPPASAALRLPWPVIRKVVNASNVRARAHTHGRHR